MIWHLHRWTKWRSFIYISQYWRVVDGLPGWHTVREPMQEKTCRKCGKLEQRKV